jgi:3-hydroxyisobutyrate dehydrogenase-like beta-hydroxyacid dehydrogenase
VTLRTVGIISAGEMGSGVGTVLTQHGLRVLTLLDGRGQATRERAAKAGMADAGDYDTLVRESEILLSILPPAAATALAEQVASAVRRTGAELLYADCNAVAPGTARTVAAIVTEAGARFADAGIIGPPPTRPGSRIFTSGPGAGELVQLGEFGIDIKDVQGEVGKASGLKMCYAALTKGLQALGTELLTTARVLGVDDELAQQQSRDMAPVRAILDRSLSTMIPKAYRWVGEMEEIAKTFEEVGLPGATFTGAADVYRRVAEIADQAATRDDLLERLADASLLHRHVALFNHGVRSGVWEPMLADFDSDAEMVFEGAPMGPFRGREAIRAAYESQPPDDEIDVLSVRSQGNDLEADYAWRRAAGQRSGRMILSTVDRRIARLVVTVDKR